MGARITIDGLWRCLCPSFDAIAYTNRPQAACRAQASRLLASRCSARSLQGQRRGVHGTTTRRQRDEVAQNHEVDRYSASSNPVACLVNALPPYRQLRSATTADIYEALSRLSKRPTAAHQIAEYIYYLVKTRGEPPSTELYEYLLRAHSSTSGSLDTVLPLLQEMRTTQIQWSATIYHYILRALAVHPNYIERNTILREMRRRWLDLAPSGHRDIAIGLLRDGQYELALEKLDQMIRQGIDTPSWVFDIFVYVLGQLGFVEDALRIVHYRLQTDSKGISLNIWYFLLDVCSKHLHLDGTKYVWNRVVQPQLINPSDGMAINVLNTATRHNDPRLATRVLQYLTSRGTKLGIHHFEALVECYALANDIQNALQTLCIMAKAGIRPDCGSTRAIYQCLKTTDLIDQAIKILGDLRADNDVPLAAFNVVLEAALHSGDFDKALELYRQVHEICHTGPSLTTFKHLLNGCDDPEIAQFLLSEMDEFKIKRDWIADVRVTKIFTLHGDLATAVRYFCDTTRVTRNEISPDNAEWTAKRDAALLLLRRCVKETGFGSDEAKDVIEACHASHLDISPEIQTLEGIKSSNSRVEAILPVENERREAVGHM